MTQTNKSKFEESMKDLSIPYLIAETAYIHEGNPDYLIRIIDKLAEKNACNAIKYHILIDINSYMTSSHELYNLLCKFVIPKKTWIDILKKTKNSGFETIVLCDDSDSIDFVKENIDLVDAVELHAIALNNIEMLDKIKDLDKPIILGIGGSTIEEIEFVVDYLTGKKILLMHGFQNFPTKYEYVHFNKMQKIQKKFNLPVGYTDHCGWDNKHNELVTLAGFMAGTNIIEKHITLDLGEKRTDFNSAISVEQLKNIKKKMEILNTTKGDGSFSLTEYEKPYGKIGPMKFTIVANRNINSGEPISKEDLTFKRTGEENTLKQKEFLDLLGKKAKKNISKDEIINWNNIEK